MRSAPADRTRWATTVAAAVLCAGLLGAGLTGCASDDPYVAPSPTPSTDGVQPAAAAETLTRFERAVRRHDAAAAARLGSDGRASELLRSVTTTATEAGIDDLTLRYITEGGQVGPDGTWTATVSVSWRVSGFDASPAHGDVQFAFSTDGSRIAGIGGGADLTPVWLAGATAVRRTDDVVVLSAAGALPVGALADEAENALTAVRGVLGERAARLVVEVPASVDAMNAALGLEAGSYDTVAAVTTAADGVNIPGRPIHVFLNADVYRGLDPLAAQVVMTHESVHAVTAAPEATGVESWLLEGFADYVALRDVDLPLSRTAGQVIAQVRTAGVPKQLPSRLDLDSQVPHVGAAYEAAWLVCVTLAEHGGEEALVDFYDDVLGGADLERALRNHFGWTVADLTRAWQDKLTAISTVDG